jgi:hypothetical protein
MATAIACENATDLDEDVVSRERDSTPHRERERERETETREPRSRARARREEPHQRG